MASEKKGLSRRHLLALAGGSAGLLFTGGLFRAAKSGGDLSLAENTPTGNRRSNRASQHDTEVPAGAQSEAQRAQNRFKEASAEALSILGAVKVGTELGAWRVAQIHDFHFGAVPVILESRDGSRFQVDVLRRDGRPDAARGIAETRHLSLFLANQGSGKTSSNENQGLGLMTLAAAIKQHEPRSMPSNMLTLARRQTQHPRAKYTVLI